MPLINSNCLKQYKLLHDENKNYGTTSLKLLPVIDVLVKDLKPNSILDYGCVKGELLDLCLLGNTKFVSYKYDPAIEEFREKPLSKIDMVINTDVLEHIPEEDIDEVLLDISQFSKNVYFNISCRKAMFSLPDGSNAHCTVYPPNWWKNKLNKYFCVTRKIPNRDKSACSFITWELSKKSRIKLFFLKLFHKLENKKMR